MQNSEKKVLHSLDEYIALGFDADHCLVRYRLPQFFTLIYTNLAKAIVEKHGYPAEMLEFGKREKCFIFNGLLIDFKTAYIMKIGENKVILRAYYGYDRVSQEDLEKVYGSPPRFEMLDPYVCYHQEYRCCVSFFDCFIPPLIAHMVAYKKKTHHLEEVNAKQIFNDLAGLYWDTFVVYGKELASKIDDVIYKQDRIVGILKSLREKGKALFLVSNSPLPYLSLIMEHAYGKDWLSLFDYVIPESSKPHFFTNQEKPFHGIDEKGAKIENEFVKELKRHGAYVGGNAKTLEENIKTINGGKEGRVVFFGDSYSSDVLAAERIDHWDGVCIMEELDGVDFGEDYDDTCWGHWQYEDTPSGRIPTFWYSYMINNSAICTPLVDSKEMIDFFEGKEKKNE